MVHKYLVITILTILIFGTISSLLVSDNNSGNGTFSYPSNSAFAAKAQKKSSDSGITVGKLESSETLKQQEKVDRLLQEASDAGLDAKLGQDAANNATENAKSLQAAALEADKKVANLEGAAKNDSDKNDKLLSTALTDAKEKHRAASLAEVNAKALSDKSDALDKAADKAEKLAVRAQKQLESIIEKNGNDLGSDTVGQGKVSTGVEDQNNMSSNTTSAVVQNDDENASSSSDKQLGKAERIDSGVSKNSDKVVSKSKSEPTTTKDTNTRGGDAGTDINMNNYSNTSDGGREGKLQKGNSSLDLGQLLAQAEQNAHSANTVATKGLISPEVDKSATNDNNSDSSSNALAINSTDSLNIQSLTTSDSSSPKNTSKTAVESYQLQSENQTTLNGGIPMQNDTLGENKNTTTSNSTGPGNTPTNFIQTGLSGNNSSVLAAVNSTGPIQEDATCNIAIDNSTSSLPSNSGFNMSENKQDDGGCYPNSSTSGQFRYLVWSEGDEDSRFILFKRSNDGGKTFNNAITLSGNAPSAVFNPKLSSEGNNVFVVWQGDSNSGNQDILMRKSTDNGKTFGGVINLSNDRAGSGNPEINVNASSVYVVWDGTTPGNNEIFYRRSLNNGSNFDSVRNLSNDGGVSYEPKVVVNKKALEVYWRDYKNGHEDILVKRSINEGKSFDVLNKINKDVLGLWKDRGGLDLRLNH
jgi:hypothetical protein